MKVLAVAALVVSGLCALSPARAEQLEGDQIRGLVAGKTVLLSTPYGLELPLRYRANGVVAGDVSGFTLAKMFAPKEEGRWWVDGSRLCQQWKSWYDGKTLCFTIRKTGDRTIDWVRQDGYSGSARIEG
jgi:hypothetical protein